MFSFCLALQTRFCSCESKSNKSDQFFLKVLEFLEGTLFTLGLLFCVFLSLSNNGTQVQPTAMDT